MGNYLIKFLQRDICIAFKDTWKIKGSYLVNNLNVVGGDSADYSLNDENVEVIYLLDDLFECKWW
jgi:hypothetical protein